MEDEMHTAQNDKVAPAEKDSSSDLKSDLTVPIWSVVSFDGLIESGLTYDDAMARMAVLHTENVSGLCIVTDDAAEKISK